MRVIELSQDQSIYTCRSYLILGDWNVLGDIKTLIDPGTDGSVINQIESLSIVPTKIVSKTHRHENESNRCSTILSLGKASAKKFDSNST